MLAKQNLRHTPSLPFTFFFFALITSQVGSHIFASDSYPPDLHLSSSWDYRYEPLHPDLLHFKQELFLSSV
jgi:hypothetical protein